MSDWWHLTVGAGGRPACQRGIGFPMVQCEYGSEAEAKAAAAQNDGLAVAEGPCPTHRKPKAKLRRFLVEGYWHTIRQATTVVKATTAAKALELAIDRQDEWIGDNEECDDSDGPTSFEVHQGDDLMGKVVLFDPADHCDDHAHKLRQALADLLACPDLNLDELEPFTRLAIDQAEAALALAKDDGPRTPAQARKLLERYTRANKRIQARERRSSFQAEGEGE